MLGQASTLNQIIDNIGTERLLELSFLDRLVGACTEPRTGSLPMPILLEAIKEPTEAATQNSSNGSATKKTAQPASVAVAQAV